MRIGAHVDPADPLDAARARGADAVQFFLTDPQGYKNPIPREDTASLRESEVDIYIHAPYIVNVASPNNRIRIPSRKLLMAHARAAAELGAEGLSRGGPPRGRAPPSRPGFGKWPQALRVGGKSRRPPPADPDREHGRG